MNEPGATAMTHQYRAEDFADLPRKALEALGVWVCWKPEFGSVAVQFSLSSGDGRILLLPSNAAALLIGMVQQRCDVFFVYEVDERRSAADLLLVGAEEGSVGDSGTHRGFSPLSAVLSAYAAALEAQ